MEPLLEYIELTNDERPNDFITVLLPEFVPARWWHHLLHNQRALLIKGRSCSDRTSWSRASVPLARLTLVIPLSRIPHRFAVPALLAVSIACGFGSLVGDSVTFDETAHLGAGVSYLETGDFRLNPEHPPLAKMIAAAPLSILHRGEGTTDRRSGRDPVRARGSRAARARASGGSVSSS
jgi:hypothetical protein